MAITKLRDLSHYSVTYKSENGKTWLEIRDLDTGDIAIVMDGDRVVIDGQSLKIDIASSGQKLLNGNTSANFLSGNNGANTINGGAGDDLILGLAGNDEINGDNGNDIIYAGRGDDYILGGGGSDWLAGEEGNDTIGGGAGDDTIYGGLGSNFLSGDDGDDLIFVAAGANSVFGGRGIDAINFSYFQSAVPNHPRYQYDGIFVYQKRDTGEYVYRSLTPSRSGVAVEEGNFSNFEQFVGSSFADRIWVGRNLTFVNAGGGDDIIEVDVTRIEKNATLQGGGGDDVYKIDFSNGALNSNIKIAYNSGRDRIVLTNVDEITTVNKVGANDFDIFVREGTALSTIRVVNGWNAYQAGNLNILREWQKSTGESSIWSYGNPPSAYLNKFDFLPATLTGTAGNDIIENAIGHYDWVLSNFNSEMYQNSLCTMTGGKGGDNFLLWSGGVITDFNGKEDTLIFAKEVFGSLDDVKKLKRREFNGNLVIDTPWKVPSGLPDANQPIQLKLLGVTEAEFVSAFKAGHVLSQSLAGV